MQDELTSENIAKMIKLHLFIWQREVLLMTLHKFNTIPYCTLPAQLFFIVYCFVSVFVCVYTYMRSCRSIIRECLRRDFSRGKKIIIVLFARRDRLRFFMSSLKEIILKKLSTLRVTPCYRQNGGLKCIKG